jgi:hypothetical protein
MGKSDKALKDFIGSIPDNKLQAFPEEKGVLVKNTNFRLDMQGVRKAC